MFTNDPMRDVSDLHDKTIKGPRKGEKLTLGQMPDAYRGIYPPKDNDPEEMTCTQV